MLLNGSLKTNKTELLVNEYVRLIQSGVEPSDILVINLNKFKNERFIESVKEKTGNKELKNHRIQTFFGHCYNAMNDNWEYLDSKIKTGKKRSKPNLCGLELSQFIFAQSIKNGIFKDYMSKHNLFHQLFKRYSLIVQNNLSDEEVKKRSVILKETFFDDTKKAIDFYKLKTLEYRSFDYLRQIAIFREIYLNTDYYSNIKYLFVDDADEITYAIFEFIDFLKPKLSDFFIAYDSLGSSRCGYLSAYRQSVNKFEEMFNEKALKLTSSSPLETQADKLYLNMKSNVKSSLESVEIFDCVKRLDMIEKAVDNIKDLIKNGVKPEQISIVTPLADDMLKFSLNERLASISHQIITGSEKLSDNKYVKIVLLILKLTLCKNQFEVERNDIVLLLSSFASIPVKYVYQALFKLQDLNDFKNIKFEQECYDKSFAKLLLLFDELENSDCILSDKLAVIYKGINKDDLKEDDFRKLEFLEKEIKSFEVAFDFDVDVFKIITQLENSIISENPSVSREISPNSIVVATPQKIIDFEIVRDYQFWLDISSFEWVKEDIGTLYNSWVFNKDYDRENFEHQDNVDLTREKTARVLRKLLLCTNKKTFLYSALYDSFGIENYGGLTEFFSYKPSSEQQKFKIIPRQDQKSVLEYTKGQMGVMAVPGAGKTTVLLALVLKLLQNGIKSENIFVLTYMDSAAKNFRERIKMSISDSFEMPNISTIHGLALRIIKENANYSRIGLSENFEICDDTERERIIKTVMFEQKIDTDNYDAYSKSISAVKLSKNEPQVVSKYKNINDFFRFFKYYNEFLAKNNMIDYDDMLCLAVRLLEENPDILSYYQNLCCYIIEDEAQDSSSLQQHLLKMLSEKHKNLVRCGDINQAITTTFTNTNPEDFRDFIKTSKSVEMNTSQRSAKPIYELANSLVDYASKDKDLSRAFYKISMQGTGANPESSILPQYKTFKTKQEEQSFIEKEAKRIFKDNPNTTIAVLLRNNYQVKAYERFFNSTGLKTISRTDFLDEKPTFKVIFSILKLNENPFSRKLILEIANVLNELDLIKFISEDMEYLKKLETPFVLVDIDDLTSESLKQFHSDVEYFIECFSLPIDVLSVKIGLYYFTSSVEKSNVYLIAMFIRRLMNKYTTIQKVLEELESIAQRPIGSGFRFFSSEETEGQAIRQGKISIMTVHKSKGDEFDVVFIPEFSNKNYSTAIQDTTLKSETFFTKTILSLSEKSKQKTDNELKFENIFETLRLVYVAITRAKKMLFFTSNQIIDKGKNNVLMKELLSKDISQ